MESCLRKQFYGANLSEDLANPLLEPGTKFGLLLHQGQDRFESAHAADGRRRALRSPVPQGYKRVKTRRQDGSADEIAEHGSEGRYTAIRAFFLRKKAPYQLSGLLFDRSHPRNRATTCPEDGPALEKEPRSVRCPTVRRSLVLRAPAAFQVSVRIPRNLCRPPELPRFARL